MNKKDIVLKLWRECFDDSDQFIEMFFTSVYRDDDALVLEKNGRVVSSMLLQRYSMDFHGVTLPVSYICGAATAPEMRAHGYMAELLAEGLNESYRRGDAFSTLIPASDWLFKYYEKAGFSPVFYTCVEHFTSAHPFRHCGVYASFTDIGSDEAYDFFNSMMELRPCCVQHTREQYHNIVMDNSVDGGSVIAVSDSCGRVVAMAFAVPADGEVTVKELLAVDEDAANGVLSLVKETFGDMPMAVWRYFSPGVEPRVRGMARVVNVDMVLSVLARRHPELKLAVRVRDRVIAGNCHIYVVGGGECREDDAFDPGSLDYDVDVEVLTSILFGNEVTEKILDFPAVRPYISLMLD
ncbi:MAG: GNAT family N-acetyltransferase [Lachnospiraceae bacterium]|nr:GNAT family N-acetyltransferase [Lachnospiraceae bacterium]